MNGVENVRAQLIRDRVSITSQLASRSGPLETYVIVQRNIVVGIKYSYPF